MARERVDSYEEFLACQYGTRKRLVESVGSFDHKVEPDDLLPLENRHFRSLVYVIPSARSEQENVILGFEIFDEPSRDWKICNRINPITI
jgi:hypothetical protein